MPRDHPDDHRRRQRSRSPARKESRGDYRSTSDGRVKWREKRDEKDESRHRRHDDHHNRGHGHRVSKRSRSKSPPPTHKPSNLDKFKPSGLLNAMNPVSEPSASGSSKSLSKDPKDGKKVEEKIKPDFKLSGKLAEDTNKFNGVVVKYNEPPEAKKPSRKWRLYPFKGDQELDMIEIDKQSAFLLGRDRRIVDIPIDHPSCSQQHAVIQFRGIKFDREDGSSGKKVRPYLIDLESSNGTFLNNKQIEPRKYYELLDKDMIKFGFSSREYVLMHAEYNEDAGKD